MSSDMLVCGRQYSDRIILTGVGVALNGPTLKLA
jgi:hypothetical protein